MKEDENVYYYILVEYEDYPGYKKYNYISDDTTVKEGDRVLVNRAGDLAVAEVLETGYFNKLNAPFPVDKTKKIIKKVDENFEIDNIEFYDEEEWDYEGVRNSIRMNIEGTYFEFGIENYVSGQENDDNWAKIKIKIKNNYFNYFRNAELMTSDEVEDLLTDLELLLNDKLEKYTKIELLEPDLTFELYPKINLWDTGEFTYIKEGHEIQDIFVEMNVNLTDRSGAYIGQKYVITFDRKEIEKLVDYIKGIIEKMI